MRLDVYLVQNGHFSSRELAKTNIAKGNVMVNSKVASKPSQFILCSDSVELSVPNVIPYVSKGGLKLEKAFRSFSIDCTDMQVIDVGASTGGFTDCALKHGAQNVTAIDVGTNQLSPALRNNHKVFSMENTNITTLDLGQLPNKGLFNLLVADLSFVSLTRIVQHLPKFLLDDGKAILLIKPQFEVGPSSVGKRGIVKNLKDHLFAIDNVTTSAKECGLYLSAITYAPIHQIGKNIEYLALFLKQPAYTPKIIDIVNLAFEKKKNLRNG